MATYSKQILGSKHTISTTMNNLVVAVGVMFGLSSWLGTGTHKARTVNILAVVVVVSAVKVIIYPSSLL